MPTLDKNSALAGLEQLFGSPALFAQHYDPLRERVLLLRLNERHYREAAFLDDRLAAADIAGFWVGLTDIERRFRSTGETTAPRHWIFHIGHCGSTLLSKLLAGCGSYLPLREPPVLRNLADALRELDSPLSRIAPDRWPQLLNLFLALLGRRFDDGAEPMVKATSDCNNLIAPILESAPAGRALLLYLPLDDYLATMLRAGGTRTDTEGHAASRLQDLLALSGNDCSLRLHELSLAQRAVVNWMSCMMLFAEAEKRFPERTRRLDFNALLEGPAETIAGLCEFLGTNADLPTIEAFLANGVMDRYAKAPQHAYSAQSRRRDLNTSYRRNATEIGAALDWARQLIDTAPSIGARIDRDLVSSAT